MGRFIGFLDRWSRWPKLSRIEKMSASAIVHLLAFLIWIVSFGVIIGCAFNEVKEVHSSFVIGEFFGRIYFMVQELYALTDFLPIWFAPRGPRRTNRVKVGKKKRRKRGVWFGRRKRRCARSFTKRSAARSLSKADEAYADWLRGWADRPPCKPEPFYKTLARQSFAHVFTASCAQNSRFLSLLCGFDEFRLIPQSDLKLLSSLSSYIATLYPLLDPGQGHPVDGCFHLQSVYFGNASDTPIVFDTGASTGVTPHREDFEEFHNSDGNLTGIAQKAQVKGWGFVRWKVRDDNGQVQEIRHRALYVPSAQVRLFSPQVHFQVEARGGNGSFMVHEHGCVFRFPFTKSKLTFYATNDRLPIARPTTCDDSTVDQAFAVAPSSIQVTLEENLNMTPAQRELKLIHDRLGHFNFQWIQRLTRVREGDKASVPIIPTRYEKTSSCEPPVCAACQYGKAKRRAIETEKQSKIPSRDGVLKAGILQPGQVVSSDQFTSSERGRREDTRGKEQENEKYGYGTIFVDTATSYMFVRNQITTTAAETLRAKHAFEQEARSYGVDIQGYRTDQGVYKSQEFIKDLELKGQSIEFSGVGAHHQNGIAENAIRTITESARTMLLHAMIHWPAETKIELWPFAVDYAVYLWNRLPKKDTGLAPIELFSGVTMNVDILQKMRVFGCPCYVLDAKVQDGKKLPRWQPKSRRGQFLGMSTRHASTIGLIRNLRTGAVSSQFHVVYDEKFTTIPLVQNPNTDEPEPENWEELLTFSRDKVDLDDEPPLLHEDWLTDQEKLKREEFLKRRAQSRSLVPPLRKEQAAEVETNEVEVNDPMLSPEGDDDIVDEDLEPRPPRRSGRNRHWNRKFYGPDYANKPVKGDRYYGPDDEVDANFVKSEFGLKEEEILLNEIKAEFGVLTPNDAFLSTLSFDEEPLAVGNYWAHVSMMQTQRDEDNLIEDMHPFAFAAKANNEDTPNYHQAMNGPDALGYEKAMDEEYYSLKALDPWDEVPRSEAIEKGANILPSTWAFKCKRYPDGTVKKYKARWCIRGDRQIEGVDFFETYAPVVSWSTVRLLLIMSIVLGLATRQVDYTLAFVQADLDVEVYCEMPKRYERPGYIFKLKKSVYGLRQSPLNFFKTLKKGLEDRGFRQSKNEPCLFLSEIRSCV